MKAYTVKVSISRIITVYEDAFKEDDPLARDFDEYTAQSFAIGVVRERLESDPNYANVKVIDSFEYEITQ